MPIKGFDTSSNQASTVNTILAKQNGYEFCFLRIGNGTKKDKCFENDLICCKGAGIKVGVYYGSTCLTREGAIKEAEQCLAWLGGRKFDLPIVYDMEVNGMATASRKIPNAIQYNAFAGIMRANGYPTMYYCSANRWRNYIEQDMIYDPLWLASYGKNDGSITPLEKIPNIGRTIDIHQYTSASVPRDFFPYKLDRNLLYTSYARINAMPTTKVMHTTRDITVWLAPSKKDEYRLKKIPPDYAVTLYPEFILSKSGEGDFFYRTVKNCFVLAKYMR